MYLYYIIRLTSAQTIVFTWRASGSWHIHTIKALYWRMMTRKRKCRFRVSISLYWYSNKIWSKKSFLYHLFIPLSSRNVCIQNARWWGGDNLSIKGLYLKTLCDLHFLERSCRIKSWAEDASVCKSKPGGDSDFRILMRERSYGEPTDGEDRSAEWSEAIGQAKMMWTFLSKPAQGPIYLPHNPGEIQFDRTLPCCMGGRAPTIARTFVLWYTWRRRHRFRASPTFQ